jgi:hypothetical protein
MSRNKLNTSYIYCIRNTQELRVYRSARSTKFVITVKTLGQY